jgi:hypothetical protein
MGEVLLGCIGIGATILLGLVGIAIAVFFGLRSFSGGIKDELSTIKTKVIEIQQTAQNVWDVVRTNPLLVPGGTIEGETPNLGKLKITAEPHLDYTFYFVEVTKHIFDDKRIVQVSKETELTSKEKEMFGTDVAIRTLVPTRIILKIPSIDPKLCAKYMSYFIKWLDSAYFQSLPKIDDFEKLIKI